ncbi:cadherin repeat domain-containing protein [Vibrio diazotrophicus]|uniref:cadherin repeat domain-containing protein n=1 Tax=Vibrio diazotrophicus TaxID=685 RepID=UPI000C9DE215|nr:cadherin repeat domain-containing protein [Vibrio diazotrophicus]PNH96620.1 cadherin repeat domain-containing protein [Vibrio diazotrophicus]
MNARTLSQFMLANITLVIDRQGQIRELIAGAQPAPGEVVMTVSDDANPQVQAQLIQANDQQTPLNIDDEVAQILAQLEQGVDPTLNPDQATAAGGANGSSPTDTGTIDMTLAEVLAQTAFDTNGLQAPGLSQTQSLAIDLVIAQALAPIAPVVNAAVLDVDEAPYFVDVPSDDPQDSSTDSNDDGKVDSYTFGYNENSTVDDLIGTVQAIDPEGGTVTYRIDPESEHAEYFSVTEEGKIYLTAAGVAAFTNDFEAGDDNQHNITVIASDGVNEVSIPVTLNELDVNEAPQFVDPEIDDDPNDTVIDEDNDGVAESYDFSYYENSTSDDILGVVKAEDPEGGTITYSIDPNSADAQYFTINSNGEIRLTSLGVSAFTNDFEDADIPNNLHEITVIASDGVNEVSIPVTLNELNVDEAPYFVSSPSTDGNDFSIDNNDDGIIESYVFGYDENSETTDVLGIVKAQDAEGETIKYSIDPSSEDAEYFTIDPDSGEIYLSEMGVSAYTNDFEWQDNQHHITVIATESDNGTEIKSTSIEVTLNEQNLDESVGDDAPYFIPVPSNDSDDDSVDDNNDGVVESYSFGYDELSSTADLIGKVQAVDPENETLIYSITSGNEEGYFTINSNGEIYLTEAGVTAFTNDYESLANSHQIMVTATETAGGEGTVANSVSVPVTLIERDVNLAPTAEDFTVTVGNNSEVQIVFDDADNEVNDHISDIEEDDIKNLQLHIVLTSLPDSGTLLYTEDGVARELTAADVYDSEHPENAVLLDPDKITFVPSGNEVVIGSTEDGSLVAVGDDYHFILDNGNTVYISAIKTLGSGATRSESVTLVDSDQQGTGLSVEKGSGINNSETLIVDLSENPLYSVDFGVDGLNSNHEATVTYYFESGNPITVTYDANGDYTYTSSSDNPVTKIEFTASSNDQTSGANYVVTHLSGTQTVAEDTEFDYMSVDSKGAFSDVATVTLDTDESTPSYHVFSAQEGEAEVLATSGEDMLLGDSQANIFTWLDSALDNSTDIIKNFEFGVDKVDLTSILDDDTETTDISDLLGKVTISSVDNEDVVLTMEHGASESQTIIIEDIYADIAGMEAADILNSLVKVNTETV